MSIQYSELSNRIDDTSTGESCQPPQVAPGQLMYDFSGGTHLVHSVIVHYISNHPHAIARCGVNLTVGGSTMATSRAPYGDPTCVKCSATEGPPDVEGEMWTGGERLPADRRTFWRRMLSEVIFQDGEVVAIKPLGRRAQR